MKELYFSQPSPHIGEVIERFSTVDADKSYTTLDRNERKKRKRALMVLGISIVAFSWVLIYLITDSIVWRVIFSLVALFAGYIIAETLVYPEKNILKGVNVFIGTKGAEYVEVSEDYDNQTKRLYLYDDIADIDTHYTIIKIQNDAANETKYYPRRMKIDVNIMHKNGKKEHRSFEYPLKYVNERYEIDDADDIYKLHRFLEQLEKQWRIYHGKNSAPEQLHADDVAQTAEATPDPAFEIEAKDLFLIVPLSLLITATILYAASDTDSFFTYFFASGILGGYITGLFAAFKPMRLLHWALILNVFGGIFFLIGKIVFD